MKSIWANAALLDREDSTPLSICNDCMYDIYGCVDWNMSAYCIENRHYTFIDTAIYSEDGHILDDNYSYAITLGDLVEACEYCGIDIAVLAEYYGYKRVEQFKADVQQYPYDTIIKDITYIIELH